MTIAASSFPLDAKYFSGLRNITPSSLRVDSEGLVNILNFIQSDLANGNTAIHAMNALGNWAVDGDGAETNGAGLVGADILLTEAAAAYAKVEDDGVFANLNVSGAEAGYAVNYQHFPDVPVADTDYLYLGDSVPFCEFAFGYGTPAVYNALDVVEWFYWDGTIWSALTIVHDGSNATITDGGEYGERNGALSFIPPTDWAATVVDSQNAYWIRAGIATGKAANMTTVPISSEEHQVVSPADAWVSPSDGTVTRVRASTGLIDSSLSTAEELTPMNVDGLWAIDGDGAETNGAGLVGADVTLTTAAAALAVAEDGAVFALLSATAAEPGYTSNFQLFPDVPLDNDAVYFGAAIQFPELAFDMSVVQASAVGNSPFTWEYWNGAWSALTVAHDGSSTVATGVRSFERDGALSFVPPTDWASTSVNGQAAFWVRCRVSTQADIGVALGTVVDEHKLVSPDAGFIAPRDASYTGMRVNSGIAVSPASTENELWDMPVGGIWAVDGDGVHTNGGGLVGAAPNGTTQASTLAKAEDGAVFADLSVTAAEPGYTSNFQLFPDVSLDNDAVYFGGAIPFGELGFNTAVQQASAAGNSPFTWEYWNGAWTAIAAANIYDHTNGAADFTGARSFEQDGAINFALPADWTNSTIDGQDAFWIRCRVSTQADIGVALGTLSDEHDIITPANGYPAREAGTIIGFRAADFSTTLAAANDTTFILMNFTTGDRTALLTWNQGRRNEVYSALSLSVSADDELGIIIMSEDGTNERAGVTLELEVTVAVAAVTLPAANATLFILMNYTTGDHSGELTWPVSSRTEQLTFGTALDVNDGDELGIVITQEDGTQEHYGVAVELIEQLTTAAVALPSTADTKFILMNYTTGAHSGELTWAVSKRTDSWTTTLAIADGDQLGVLVTQEDGVREHVNVAFELEIQAVAA